MAHPMRYVIDPRIVGTEDGAKAKAACKYDAVDLDQQEQEIRLPAARWCGRPAGSPTTPRRSSPTATARGERGEQRRFERMADPKGPTGGDPPPSDGKEAKKVAFIQCAGSRDQNHLLHCSRICCMASLKQSTYVTDAYPDADVSVYYIDIRAIDRFETSTRRSRRSRTSSSSSRSRPRSSRTRPPVAPSSTASTPRATCATPTSRTWSCWRWAWSPLSTSRASGAAGDQRGRVHRARGRERRDLRGRLLGRRTGREPCGAVGDRRHPAGHPGREPRRRNGGLIPWLTRNSLVTSARAAASASGSTPSSSSRSPPARAR